MLIYSRFRWIQEEAHSQTLDASWSMQITVNFPTGGFVSVAVTKTTEMLLLPSEQQIATTQWSYSFIEPTKET